MAWKNKYRTTKKPKTSSRLRRPKYSELEKLAFKLGQVQRGLRNPDSRVFESYNNGKKSPNYGTSVRFGMRSKRVSRRSKGTSS